MQIQREIKTRDAGTKNALRDGVLELAHSFLFRPSWDAHEKTKDTSDGTEGVHIIVVKTQTKIRVSEIGVQSFCAQEMRARTPERAALRFSPRSAYRRDKEASAMPA